MIDIIKCKIKSSNKCYSGGGQYDESGKGYNIGKWFELKDDFHKYNKITNF